MRDTMKTDPRVSTSSVEKLSTLSEETQNDIDHVNSAASGKVDIHANAEQSRDELNNNINNNNKKLIFDTKRSTSVETKDSVFLETGSRPTTPLKSASAPTTPQTDGWVGVGTWRRRKLCSEKAKSLKKDNEELGLEHVIPYHRSPKALSEMGKLIFKLSSNVSSNWVYSAPPITYIVEQTA